MALKARSPCALSGCRRLTRGYICFAGVFWVLRPQVKGEGGLLSRGCIQYGAVRAIELQSPGAVDHAAVLKQLPLMRAKGRTVLEVFSSHAISSVAHIADDPAVAKINRFKGKGNADIPLGGASQRRSSHSPVLPIHHLVL